MARWHGTLQNYFYKIQHVPGKLHTAADALSRPSGVDEGKEDNQDMIMIPDTRKLKATDFPTKKRGNTEFKPFYV